MFFTDKDVDVYIPIRCESSDIGIEDLIAGQDAGEINLKIANKDSIAWEDVVETTGYTIQALGDGDYTLCVKAAINDTYGFLRAKIFDNESPEGATFDELQYVIGVYSWAQTTLAGYNDKTSDLAGNVLHLAKNGIVDKQILLNSGGNAYLVSYNRSGVEVFRNLITDVNGDPMTVEQQKFTNRGAAS